MKRNEHAERTEAETGVTNGSAAARHSDATIEQVRDLLFGGAQRSIETQLAALRDETKSSLAALEAKFTKELASIQEQLLQLERATDEKRLASHRDIGAAISRLGESISGLGAASTSN